MTNRDRRIVESIYRESPDGRPSFGIEVLVPTGIFTAAAYVIADTIAADDGRAAAVAASLVCFFALVVLLYLWHAEGRPKHITEHTTEYRDDDGREAIRPFVGSSDANRITVGRWTFTEAEWGRLGRVLATGRVSRSALADLQTDDGETMFPNITAAYPGIVAELQRLGWIDDDNATTEAARRWFDERGIPPLARVSRGMDQR